MSDALDPHCWKATSFADPEYVMDFKSPNAFCALAITVFASCAMAFPHRNARQMAITASFFDTVSPPNNFCAPIMLLLEIRLPVQDNGERGLNAFLLRRNRRENSLSVCGDV